MSYMNIQNAVSRLEGVTALPTPRCKVAVVYHFFPHYRLGVMKALQRDEANHYLFVGDRTDPEGAIKACDLSQFDFLHAPCIILLGPLLWQKGILRLAWSSEIDTMIFLGNANFLSTWAAAALARLRGKRVLFWTHGWVSEERGVKAVLRKLFYRLANGLLLYGRRAKAIAVCHGFSRSRLYVIFNSLDYETQQAAREAVSLDELRAVRAKFFDDPSVPVLICTSRLTPLRGLEQLIEAMRRLRDQGTPSNLLLVGDGPERERLGKLAHRLGVRVHFYGACYDERRLAELIMAANMTVAPGQVGLTAIHSLTYGTPVITHGDADYQMPEWEAIEPGETGDYFRRDDIKDLAKVLAQWCRRSWPDPMLRRRCIDMVDRFYNPRYQSEIIGRAVAGEPCELDRLMCSDERVSLQAKSHAATWE